MLFLFIWIIVASTFVAVITRCDLFIFLWNNHYHIFSKSINFFLLFPVCFSLSIWIIVAGMSLAFLREVISLYVCGMIFILYPFHWLIFYFVRSVWCAVCCFCSIGIVLAGMFVAVLHEVISLYICEMSIIIYSVHWLILCSLSSVLYCISFHLN